MLTALVKFMTKVRRTMYNTNLCDIRQFVNELI
jgi:hypothetical protein